MGPRALATTEWNPCPTCGKKCADAHKQIRHDSACARKDKRFRARCHKLRQFGKVDTKKKKWSCPFCKREIPLRVSDRAMIEHFYKCQKRDEKRKAAERRRQAKERQPARGNGKQMTLL